MSEEKERMNKGERKECSECVSECTMREREKKEKYEKVMRKTAYDNGNLTLHEYTTVPELWLTWLCSTPSHHMPLDTELELV